MWSTLKTGKSQQKWDDDEAEIGNDDDDDNFLSTAEYIEVVAGGGGGVAAEVQGCQPPPVGGRGLEASTPREVTLHQNFQNSLKKEIEA